MPVFLQKEKKKLILKMKIYVILNLHQIKIRCICQILQNSQKYTL